LPLIGIESLETNVGAVDRRALGVGERLGETGEGDGALIHLRL